MKCKHEKFTLIEHVKAYTTFDFINGELSRDEDGRVEGYHSDHYPDGRITVSCHDCSYNKTFEIGSRRIPAWIKRAWDEVRA